MSKPGIGVVGAGRVGLAMVKSLLRNGYPVTVADIAVARVEEAAAAGATAAGRSCVRR